MSSLADYWFPSAATYRFVEEIGRGGMGVVYLAEKHSMGVSDLVVLKTIRTMEDVQLERLKREANIATTLRHENIVRTFGLETIPFDVLPDDFQAELQTFNDWDSIESTQARTLMTHLRMGITRALEASMDLEKTIGVMGGGGSSPGKRLYLMVMEYIEGWDLRKIHSRHIRAGLLVPITLNAFIISRLCRALAYAHQYIVHRDLSPENILITHQGVTKLMDFGIAVAADQAAIGLAGKIQYMAPEQVREERVDNRSDIFALGLVAYHMLTGISPFKPPTGSDFGAQVTHYEQRLKQPIVPPHEVCRDVPEAYSRIIMKMLDLDPASRYQGIDEVGSDIEKKCIYASGFGPTNNSLEAYLRIFDAEFQNCTQADLEQLTFLADEEKNYHLKRAISRDLYTDQGQRLIRDRRDG